MSQALEQLQEQKQKHKLSFEQICPRWSKVVHKVKYTDKIRFRISGKMLNLHDFKCCLVGEAWGFTDDYDLSKTKGGCKKCSKTSAEFGSLLRCNSEERKELIDAFVDHFNRVHV